MKKTTPFLALAAVGVAVTVRKALEEIQKEQKAEYNLELAARAARFVSRKMDNGGYSNLQEAMDEYDFINICYGK